MRERRDSGRMHAGSAVAALMALGTGMFGFVGASGADVATVTGGAYGYFTDISLFGGASSTRGPEPSVTLPSEGSAVPVTATVPTASAVYGPAVIFQSGPITVTTQGTTGPAGSVTSGAHIVGHPEGPGPFLYKEITSTCTADESGAEGSTTIVGGVLETKYDADTQEPTVTEPVPLNPPANYERTGTIDHVGDSYRIVFNEQVVNADGSLTVNAAHMYLLGPTAVGELIIGQSVCGVAAAAAASTTTTEPSTTESTTATTATTTEPSTTTTTTTTTTTAPATSTAAATTPADPGSDAGDEPATTGGTDPDASGETTAAAAGTVASAGQETPAPAAPEDDATVAAAALPGSGPVFFAAAAQVSGVSGGAYGFYASVSLFGGPAGANGPAPTVELPPEGANPPLTATAPSGAAQYGPATIFKSGPMTVSTRGSTGVEASVTSSADIQGVADGPGPFLYQRVRSMCTANEAGATGSATIDGGKLETKYDPSTQEPTTTEPIPVTPAPNTERTGTIDHVGDRYRIVFNEQVRNADGSITVNAAHMYLLGPIAVGELIVGQSRCGVTAASAGTDVPAATGSDSGAETARGTSSSTRSSPQVAGVATTRSTNRSTAGTAAGRRLASTGGETPMLLALALVLGALTTARWARSRPVPAAAHHHRRR